MDIRHRLSFSELRKHGQAIAKALISSAPRVKNQPVGIVLNESVEYMSAIVGVLYASHFYVPLFAGGPKQLFLDMHDALDHPLIITDLTHAGRLIRLGVSTKQIILLEEVLADVHSGSHVIDTRSRVIDTDPVYMMHTSGSTGKPKGVVIQHRSLIDYLDWLKNTFDVGSNTVMGSTTSFGFDNSVLEIFSTLLYGSTLVILKGDKPFDERARVIECYMMQLNEHQVNWIFWGPSTLKTCALLDALNKWPPRYLNHVLFCGEVMHNRTLNYWRKHLPHALYANLYGPTEITDACTCYIVNRVFADDEPLPIGMACENTEILILSEAGSVIEPDMPGVSGEILVRGTCLSAGYWKDDEETRKSFVQNPLHDHYLDRCYKTGDIGAYNDYGEILFLGRKDNQIKYYGSRVELDSIEAASLQMPEIQNSCVFFFEDPHKLVMVYQAPEEIPHRQIMLFLREIIPVIPTQYVHLIEFPLNAHGKIDRLLLRNLASQKLQA